MSVELNSMMLNVYQFNKNNGVDNFSVTVKLTKNKIEHFGFSFEVDTHKPPFMVDVKFTKELDFDVFSELCLIAGANELDKVQRAIKNK